ncbi:putative calcium-binding protein CML19 [Ananas comosus]|uniref:Calcium-binding protein CML19 n=2 Tax=Ananas comosus TaxID=4615 RepID=A0A6P5F8F4_ANACO|nr:putative calcium-binding protein CML19 [Ananas comosus]
MMVADKSSGFGRFLCMLSPKKAAQKSDSPTHSNTSTPRGSNNKSGELERVFHYLDENGDGKISPSELRNGMRAAGEDMSAEEAAAAVELSDSDGDGQLSMDDFLKLVEAEAGEEEKARSLRDAFAAYEMDGQGCITPKSLCRTLNQLGQSDWTVQDCAKMIQRYDLNGDGVLSFDEFQTMMRF